MKRKAVSEAARALGQRGGRKGGVARWRGVSKRERREATRKAGRARARSARRDKGGRFK